MYLRNYRNQQVLIDGAHVPGSDKSVRVVKKCSLLQSLCKIAQWAEKIKIFVFRDYCRQKCTMTTSYADRLIDYSEIYTYMQLYA